MMAQIRGVVISIALETDVAKQAGGSYKGWELVYKTEAGQVQTIAKHINDLKFKPDLKASLQGLLVGDKFTLVQEKNTSTGFNDVKSIAQGWDGAVSAPQASNVSSSGTSSAKGTAYQASSYPTADERNKTQNHIIRQSSLAQAVATLAIGGKAVKPDDILKVAEQYVEWVKKEKTGMDAIIDMPDDIPS